MNINELKIKYLDEDGEVKYLVETNIDVIKSVFTLLTLNINSVKPYKYTSEKMDNYNNSIDDYCCPECDCSVEIPDRFCKMCGAKIDWGGIK